MSLYLFIIERREEIKTALDVLNYLEEFSRYKEDKGYNSLEEYSPVITAWAKSMFEHFPPMNGKYALPNEIAFSSEDIEDCLTDYTLGKHRAICSFPYNVEDNALGFLSDIFDEYNIGIYDFNNIEDIIGFDIEILKYKTESTNITPCTWNKVKNSINSLGSP